jgi:hypothetical protein
MAVPLKDYVSFHGMLTKPKAARKCINSFNKSNGCIVFLPFDHEDDEIFTTYLSLISYYALVFVSWTGFSSLIGMTDTIDVQDFSENGGIQVWPALDDDREKSEKSTILTTSLVDPQIRVRDVVWEFVVNHADQNSTTSTIAPLNEDTALLKEDAALLKEDSNNTIHLQRRFEFDFLLSCGLRVIMLHVTSSNNPGALHLVEIYKFRIPLIQKYVPILVIQIHRAINRFIGWKNKFFS